MKQKLSQEQTPVFDCIFNPATKSKRQPSPAPQNDTSPIQKPKLPVYHVEKINKMKFKIYKNSAGTGHYIDKVPVHDLSFQIKIKGEHENQAIQNAKPRLD